MTIQSFRGSRDPFAGWVAEDGEPRPTDAVVTDQPVEGAWALTIWVLEEGSPVKSLEQPPGPVQWNNGRSWKVLVPLAKGPQLISRNGDTISVAPGLSPAHPRIAATLDAPPAGVADQRAVLDANYQAAAIRYPRFRDLFRYRLRASVLGIVIFAFQELFLALYRRVGGKHLTAFGILALLGWVGLSVWVAIFYLGAS